MPHARVLIMLDVSPSVPRLPKARLPGALTSLLLGSLVALTLPPLPTGALSAVAFAALLWHVARGRDTRQVTIRMFWGAAGLSAVHLWWLSAFLGHIFGTPVLGILALALFALEGSFYAIMANIAARLAGPRVLARVWMLAGGWVVLEALRFLGPFAFPWPTLGYSLLSTPMIQIADLGGVLLASVLVTATAAALVTFWRGAEKPLWVMAALWVAALAYGVTRTPAEGLTRQAIVERSTVDVFSKASEGKSAQDFFNEYTRPVKEMNRPAGVPVILPETALLDPQLLSQVPGPGVYGVGGGFTERANRATGWNGQQITAQSDKARPVPFGEYFPLQQELAPAWRIIESGLGFQLPPNLPPASSVRPLPIDGVNYGTYVCYDSVFPWVARQLTNKGANVLVNISNDGWYAGWGVEQHFMMGRVRAIENRRWVLRSVNEGIAGSIDDLGRPRRTLSRGEGALQVTFKELEGQTVYHRLGDLPALVAAGLMLAMGLAYRRND